MYKKNRDILLGIIFAIAIFTIIGINSIKDNQKETLEITKNYKAYTDEINYELKLKEYSVQKINFEKNNKDYYTLQVIINTKGNYEKEALEIFTIMYNNAISDYFLVNILDYELKNNWTFIATKKTLDDYFAGKISKQKYVNQIKTEKLL